MKVTWDVHIWFLLPMQLSSSVYTLRFPDMNILRVTKKKAPEALTQRILRKRKFENPEGDRDLEKEFSEGKNVGLLLVNLVKTKKQ